MTNLWHYYIRIEILHRSRVATTRFWTEAKITTDPRVPLLAAAGPKADWVAVAAARTSTLGGVGVGEAAVTTETAARRATRPSRGTLPEQQRLFRTRPPKHQIQPPQVRAAAGLCREGTLRPLSIKTRVETRARARTSRTASTTTSWTLTNGGRGAAAPKGARQLPQRLNSLQRKGEKKLPRTCR